MLELSRVCYAALVFAFFVYTDSPGAVFAAASKNLLASVLRLGLRFHDLTTMKLKALIRLSVSDDGNSKKTGSVYFLGLGTAAGRLVRGYM